MRAAHLLFTACAAASLNACAVAPALIAEPAPVVVSPPVAAVSWPAFMNDYIEATFRANPAFAVVSGRHEYDGQLPDWSAEGLAAEQARLQAAIDAAKAFDPARLSPTERFERDYMMAQARNWLFWIATADQPHTNPAYYAGTLDPSAYVVVPYAAPEVRMRAYTRYLSQVPRAASQIRANLRQPLPISFVDYGKSAFGGYAEYYLGDGMKAFAGIGSAAEQAELKAASQAASAAMKALTDWVEAQRPSAGTNFALGAQKFQQMLYDTEMVDTPLTELEAIGRRDMASNQALLKEACGRYDPGQTIQHCMDKMSATKPKGGAVAGARAQLAGLKQFIIDKDLVSIPGTEEAKVDEAPPYNRQNFAYINIPGPYEKGLPSVYYIAPPDPSWSKAARDAFVPGEADLLFTSVHEVWPGHFLNFLHSNRSKFTFGKVFVGYAFAEGWAHYSEEMMRQAGVGGGTDEMMVGQLSNALLRDCRFLSAIGMHSGTMTQQQSFQLFREQCYQDEGTARQQAARGTYDPAYLNYTLGKLMIRKLRDDWIATRGGRAAWKPFHDKFLSFGGPPIPLVRQQMLGGPAQAAF
ncbi:DUF885 domain-containing protein [Sphingomonas sinipercae]|uniref:DUF885 domain-containing protein n=1 Tax=Sphingomonas sinipercae TaxID=2714944 RepID=A0A6G7ZPI9_9SPHN|nr:DUF885 domain-containing protein [Sphingomonas sinipercae]QIL02848.1 DUF885 domain-containing protein [Sphingomonas sinipercae]